MQHRERNVIPKEQETIRGRLQLRIAAQSRIIFFKLSFSG
jgi:hypothetical protein